MINLRLMKLALLFLIMGQKHSSGRLQKKGKDLRGPTIVKTEPEEEPESCPAPQYAEEALPSPVTQKRRSSLPKPIKPNPERQRKPNGDNPIVLGKLKAGKEVLMVTEDNSLIGSRVMYAWFELCFVLVKQ